MNRIRTGFGYDIHKLVRGRDLLLGGIIIPSPAGESGYSDGDVLIHALIDALLGASALGDIGTHFPSGDPEFKDISSITLLSRTMDLVTARGFRIVNLDATVILETPRLAAHIGGIRDSLSNALSIPVDAVSVKAKTKEGLDATGESRSVESYCVVLLESEE
jgi:2-C-methyl-D-erythritol 2,4-cyclodiphosphate synthase